MNPPIELARFEQLKASGDLPSPKGTALAVMRMTLQEDVSMAELAHLVRTDPAFVGRLIKAANGLIGYGRRPIVSVQDALTVLGLPAVRNMALGFSLLGSYQRGACEAFDYPGYWSSSLLIAVAMQAITLRTRAAAPDETYCLGLLTRVGELALATLYPHEFSRLIIEAGSDEQALLGLEARAFSMTHAELGAAMLADWGLPRLFCNASYNVAACQECDASEGSRDAVLSISLALSSQMARLCLAPAQEQSALARRVQQTGSRLSFDAEECATLTDAVADEWREWGALLNVPTGKPPAFAEMAVERMEADAARPEASAGARNVLSVLLIDPDHVRAGEVRAALEGDSCVLVLAEDFVMATELALDSSPEVVLLAWSAADSTCLEFVRTLRKTRIGHAMYILAYASQVSEAGMIAAFDVGADDLLQWPLNPRILQAKLRTGHRLGVLQQEIQRDRHEMRHFAAELAVSHRRLQEVSLLDPLTGLPNRRSFNEALLEHWGVLQQAKRPLSCIELDVDHFRSVNDSYGSDSGDAALRQLAAVIRAALRSQDLLARTGGDEFMVMCPDASIEAAMVCAERIRSAVADARISAGSVHLNLSVSVGVAARDQAIMDVDCLLKRATQSLLLAKKGGGNCVCAVQLRPVGGIAAPA